MTTKLSMNLVDGLPAALASKQLKQEPSIDLGSGSDMNLNLGSMFTKTITQATTLTLSNVPASGNLGVVLLELTNGGAFTITFPTGSKWAAGTKPSFTASGKDLIGMYTNTGNSSGSLNWFMIAKDLK